MNQTFIRQGGNQVRGTAEQQGRSMAAMAGMSAASVRIGLVMVFLCGTFIIIALYIGAGNIDVYHGKTGRDVDQAEGQQDKQRECAYGEITAHVS